MLDLIVSVTLHDRGTNQIPLLNSPSTEWIEALKREGIFTCCPKHNSQKNLTRYG
jgi:hypothetical protein